MYALSQMSLIVAGNVPSKRSIGACGRPCASLSSDVGLIVYCDNVGRVANGV